MTKQIIIGLTSQIAAGKGTVAQYLKEKYQAKSYGFSTPLRDILKRLYLPETRVNIVDISTFLRQRFGQDALAHTIIEDIKKDDSPLIVLDGVRRLADITYAKELPNFVLVRVVTEAQTRYNRLIQRQQNTDDQSKTLEQFLEDEKRETELQIPEVMAQAQYEIDNNCSLEQTQAQIDELIKKLS